ncbi:type II secretion system F family protein [Janthinobacterium lividum]|uniref:type II secretion system F family protein n=1 Tax=Janthinobacterium lividum TaxID=29581 RepID=UPI000874EA5D|nr:type II secretion system F family protein [Janthinobacterium lividum]MCC7716720.1 type II secretion system F family protein [Janthinobacterium lividum]OEZ54272.1 type II secretion system protein F [Janthinobacterium lividum]WQE31788.1 type II secretion system F family protein [Janthinobacterium lividum]STS86056.1 Cholera toxin secretion protein epsF [Janthinobacterium lividum]
MQFKIRTFHAASGAIAERMVDGEDIATVTRMVEQQGYTVLSVAVQGRRTRTRGVSGIRGFNLVLFCDELRTLLSSGMSLVEAIDTLCTKDNDDAKRTVLLEIRQLLLEGKPLSSALELNRLGFPPLLIASIRASERTSRLDEALEEYVAYEKVGQELGRKVVSAAIYPSLVVGFGMLVCLFMISYVVPRFAKVYDDFSQKLSFSTVILMKVGQLSSDYLGLILASLAGLVALAVIGHRNGKLKIFLLRALGRFKFVQHYLRLYQLARIYQTMSMLLKGGYTLSDAIPLAQNLAFEKKLQDQILRARGVIQEGKRLSTAFAENGLTDTVTERLLQVGERSGNLARIMDIIAQTYRQEFTVFIDRATRVAEPILLMAVGIMIGAIIILMYMPVFDLAGGI